MGGKRYAPCPSYQLDRGRFENHLGDLCLQQGIRFVDRARIKDVSVNRWQKHLVSYELEGEEKQLRSSWLVDASGRRAFLKRKLQLHKNSPHTANAVWFRFHGRIKIDDWSNETNWRRDHFGKTARWYSTNHLMGQGYWVWLIPLSSGSTSIGIVAAEEFHSLSSFNSLQKAIVWLQRNEPQCADAIVANLDNLQDFRAIKNYSTECQQVFSANRWGITGEAGFFHDPFYSPGSDFIAFANTFLTDLIWRDHSWKGYRIRAFAYDRIFKRFYYGTLTAYQNQYQLFGNPIVMPTKILWDYLVYWSITGFIFFHEQTCRLTMYMRNINRLAQLSELNHFMQNFFRKWHEETSSMKAGGYVDISRIPVIREMNSQLKEQLAGNSFFQRFDLNVKQLQTLACEIVEQTGLHTAHRTFAKSTLSAIKKDAFQNIFDATSTSDLIVST